MQKSQGNLYLIPSFLSPQNDADFVSNANKQIIYKIRYFIVENIRTARRFLRAIGFNVNFEEVFFTELNKHTELLDTYQFLNPVNEGQNMGLISEAGMPCIADPGAHIVMLAHEQGIKVVPLAGGSSIIMALIASGFNGQNFAFHGYLPLSQSDRVKKLKELEQHAEISGQTQIFMETPYRNNQLFDTLVKSLKPTTMLAIAADITDHTEFIRSKKIHDWAKTTPDLNKRPTIFLISK
ncbi:MAG TPA: SAM-dependent methyltransferase [Bacteroidales bacterium]|nr:SAM-dependent methyltransferase [Bacteroidales bacterium]HRX97766.1 SAM-dependent methyltransferase [Bacteroidales bacterium]